VSYPSGDGGGIPAYGTFLYTATDIIYPVAEGGAYYENADTINYPTQYCSVDVKADGTGGEFYDWTTVTNVVYFPNGTFICVEPIPEAGNPLQVPDEYGSFYNSGTYASRNVLNLNAGYEVQYTPDTSSTFTLYPYGTFIFNDGFDSYFWDGTGSYYSETV
jgi:hypothetical protein